MNTTTTNVDLNENTHISVTKEVKLKLKRLANAEDRSIRAVIRRLVDKEYKKVFGDDLL